MTATVTEMPLLTSEGTRLSLAAIHRAELIALPLLFIALLLVFRSLAAAAIPAAFGAATIASSTGLLALLAGAVRLDAFALAISCMVGLALAAVASQGSGLLAAAVGVSIVAVVSAATAVLVVPAILVIAGQSLGGAAPERSTGGGISATIAHAAMRRPVLGLLAAGLLLAACIPAFGLRTGAPSAGSLPSDSPARTSFDDVAKAMGGGWTERFEIVAVTRKGAVTTQPRLAELARVQRRLAKDPAVRAVLGPGSIARSAAKLRRSGRDALVAGRTTRRDGGRLRKLDAGVSSAADGVGSTHSSLRPSVAPTASRFSTTPTSGTTIERRRIPSSRAVTSVRTITMIGSRSCATAS